ncbi:MAG: single-stranded-DNA-specific exonuclease RecJ [Porphyromonas sp.]|nr:single-stranded-DNA-specific exonuclease RecJ [Porphyromonas sp.]
MEYLWNLKSLTSKEEQVAAELSSSSTLLPTVAKLFVQRGVTTPEQVRMYLQPELEDLHDPFLMLGMREAVDRLNKALGQKERILIYGDYDVDGTTSVALMYKFLRQYTTQLSYYIPERYNEGSGISFQGIDHAEREGCKLMIALDCGVKAVEKVRYAKEKGIDLIICDHHVPDEELPDAVAILNPKIPGSKYPFDELSGCGVGFKLLQAFTIDNGGDPRQVYDLLDLVAVSIGADLVNLTGENRVLAYYGLKILNKNPRLGLRSIIDVSDIKTKRITMNEVVFKIGPRINASGRMQNGRESVDLLLAATAGEARKMTKNIDSYNSQRRELDKSITEQALERVETIEQKGPTGEAVAKQKIIALYDPSWHRGVIGIVASRLTEYFNRPSIVLTQTGGGEDLVCGSARSIGGFDMYAVIEQCKDLLINFGGHTYATGFTLHKDNVDAFIRRVEELGEKEVGQEVLTPQINIDLNIRLADITPTLRKQIRDMAPYGPQNEKPIFCTTNLELASSPKFMGKTKSHVKMSLKEDGTEEIFSAFAYNSQYKIEGHKKGTRVDIVYTIEEYSRMGKNMAQLLLLDFKVHS